MAKELLKHKKKRMSQAVSLLKRYYPQAECSLNYKNPLQLLIATILSAQCTDKRVNQVTKTLFKKYPSSKAFAHASLRELEFCIHSTGFFRSKARSIKSACQIIQKQFSGKVPKELNKLTSLPGVGRKTALVVLGTGFRMATGIVVDTHVSRLSRRLGFTKSKNPLKIEEDLCSLLNKTLWIYFSHALISHGREICRARIPKCSSCFLEEVCPKTGVAKK